MKYPLDPEIRKRFDQLERLVFTLWLISVGWASFMFYANQINHTEDTSALIEIVRPDYE